MGLGLTLIINDILLVYYFFIFPFVILVPLWFAIHFPDFRPGVGLVTMALFIVVLYVEISIDVPIGLIVTSGFIGAVFGASLLVWGLRSGSEAPQERNVLRVCPTCGGNLSFYPGTIRICPYCRNRLV
jgi:hypothetical protein